jgi:succinate dehydrogenase hydrophobic anchor subunit
MTSQTAIILLLALAVVAANLPWISNRILFIWTPAGAKSPWIRLGEWLLLYCVVGGLAMGLEQKSMGEIHTRDWEFYAITFCLFLVFALPGFIYRHELRHLIEREKKRTANPRKSLQDSQ